MEEQNENLNAGMQILDSKSIDKIISDYNWEVGYDWTKSAIQADLEIE